MQDQPQSLFLCFTWHVGKQKFCDTADRAYEERKRSGAGKYVYSACTLGSFVNRIREKLTELRVRNSKPTFVCVNTTANPENNTNFHNKLLGDAMINEGYMIQEQYISHNKYEGNSGRSTSHIAATLFVAREFSGLYLRGKSEIISKNIRTADSKFYVGRACNVSAIVFYVKHPNFGSTAILNCNVRAEPDLPSSDVNMDIANQLHIAISDFCKMTPSPDRFIILGDLGSEITGYRKGETIADMLASDSLNTSLLRKDANGNNSLGLCEGVGDRGINFPPTGDILMNSNHERVSLIDNKVFVADNYKVPSWGDRVLYGSNDTRLGKVYIQKCIHYEPLDDSSMRGSPRCAVTALIGLGHRK